MPFSIIQNDITKMQVDAVVNAANTQLLMGGGVCGAIFYAAGAGELQAACDKLAPIHTGDAVITDGFDLPAKYIIHTAGPVYHDGSFGEEDLLRLCYLNSLEVAKAKGCESIAFPLISGGIYGYPKNEALSVAIDAIVGWLADNEMDVSLVMFDKSAFIISQELLGGVQSFIDENFVDTRCLQRRSQPDDKRISTDQVKPFDARHIPADRDEQLDARRVPADRDEQFDARRTKFEQSKRLGVAHPAIDQSKRPGIERPGIERPGIERPGIERPSIERTVFDRSRQSKLDELTDTPEAAISTQSIAYDAAFPAVGMINESKLDYASMQLDEPFAATLMRIIDLKGRSDVDVYKRANLDRKLFSKIRAGKGYMPSKKTVVALAVALELSLAEARDLLARAGFALSRSVMFDVIVEYFITRNRYDIYEINNVLFEYDQPLLGG